MDIAKNNDFNKKFEPFIVPLQIESLEDAYKLYAMFNHTLIAEHFLHISGSDNAAQRIRDFIRDNCVYFESSTSLKYHNELHKLIQNY